VLRDSAWSARSRLSTLPVLPAVSPVFRARIDLVADPRQPDLTPTFVGETRGFGAKQFVGWLVTGLKIVAPIFWRMEISQIRTLNRIK
jgi:hypothetical protein